jgi:hypothetical protein
MIRLRGQREYLFQKCIHAASPEEFLSVQIQIADAIRAAERELHTSDAIDALTFHVNRLRLYVDGLVWLVLHPHTIRQLAKNPGHTSRIADQGDAFDQVIKSAKRNFTRYQAPVLICDVTNILKIGDLIICLDPEVPMIVECKSKLPKPQHLMQGRIGRQISRAEGTMRYLQKGSAKIFGESIHRYVVESMHKAQHNWTVVAEVCQEARQTVCARRDISEFEVLWAFTSEHPESIAVKLGQDAGPGRAAYFATSDGLMNMTDGLYPPPSVWPIPSDLRFAVLEGDIKIAHLINAKAFEQKLGETEEIEMCPMEQFPIHVKLGGSVYPLSLRFVYDVLYGFETVDSCVDGIIRFAHQLQSVKPSEIQCAQEVKPSISHVDSLEEAISLLNSEIGSEDRLVSISTSLLELLNQDKRTTVQANDLIHDVDEGAPAYAIIDWQTFRSMMIKYGL